MTRGPMCFADIDHKTLRRETEDRVAGLEAPKLWWPSISLGPLIARILLPIRRTLAAKPAAKVR